MSANMEDFPKPYCTLLARTSCRRFDSTPLPEQNLQNVQNALLRIKPLQTGQKIDFLLVNEMDKAHLTVAQGAYGRFINSPHLMIPYCPTIPNALLELGFQSQQAVIHLEELGLASCYIGAHSRVRKLQEEFELPQDSRLAAVLMYGTPADAHIENSLNQSIRTLFGSRKRHPLEHLFLAASSESPYRCPVQWQPVLEAGRWAPSATNAQPWHLLPGENDFQLFTDPSAYPIVLSAGSKLMYALYDAGIFMANISLAASALGTRAEWQLNKDMRISERKSLLPIARLTLS